MGDEIQNFSVDNITKDMSQLTVLSFRKLDDVKRLARHFQNIINHPTTQEMPIVLKYLKDLDQTQKEIFLQKREGVEVEYIFTTEKKSNLQRQRFNSIPVSEVPKLLQVELFAAENAKQVHICTDCNIEIDLNDEEPLMESLQKHFNLEVHLPKLKRESIHVAEPIILPNMSRRLSAMECNKVPSQQIIEQLLHNNKHTEKLDRMFSAKLEASLIRHLPDNSEASIDAAVKFYQTTYDKLSQEINEIDFSALTSSVAPIIMSIKDNVNQNFSADANKNFENDENEQHLDRSAKNLVKKYRYYGPIENTIIKVLSDHKLMSLVDDRTGKLAFFCMSCEYYTLRFRYDSVLNHIFSETHIHNLACILQADDHIPFVMEDRSIAKINEINKQFLKNNSIITDSHGISCLLCKTNIDSFDNVVIHMLDESHLGKLSDKIYRKFKTNNADGLSNEEWGPRSQDWTKFLAMVGKPVNNRDHVVIENFIKPSGKIANYCSCCDMTLKGPRQVVFNHTRQKKHLRYAAPRKLSLLFKNHCRPVEYYASFGNYFVCTICPTHIALPSFSAIVEHFDSTLHVETIAKLVRLALYPDEMDVDNVLLSLNSIQKGETETKCNICDVNFQDMKEAVIHILSSVQHQNLLAESKIATHKGDIISVYMDGNFVLHSEGASFNCVSCKGEFNSIRSLLSHLVYAEHFKQKPTTENVFRFYLELKHNIVMLARNKYAYYEFGKLKCGICEGDLDDGENAKRHVVSLRHKENMGASYVNVSLDASNIE